MKQFVGRLKNGNSVLIFSEENDNLSVIEDGFCFPVITLEKEFQLDYTLDTNEWFYVNLDDNEKAQMISNYLMALESSADTNNIVNRQYSELVAFYLISKDLDGKLGIIFNRIFDKYYIVSKTFLKFSLNEACVSKEENVVEFNNRVDAYWDDVTSKLYFKNYSFVKPLFEGIEKFYRCATSEEVNAFVDSEFFQIEDSFKRDKLGERALKHIAEIIDQKAIDLNDVAIRVLYNEYANDYSESGFLISNIGKFILTKSADLTNVINLLQEKYYTSQITREKRVANSTTKI
jgi:hypothetical protein